MITSSAAPPPVFVPPVSVPPVFVTAEAGSLAPGWIAGGLTILARRVLEAERAAAPRVLVACAGALPPRLEALVERVPIGSPPPHGARVVRADELAGLHLDSPATLRRAEWKHLQGMGKSYQGITDALFYKHFSLRVTRLLARTRITPNHISTFTIFVGIACTLIVLQGSRAAVIAGAALLQLHSLLDGCDGELARLRFQHSRLGQWIDSISDFVADTGFVVAIGVVAGGPWRTLGFIALAARLYLEADTYRHVWNLGRDFGAFRWWFEADKASIDDVYARGSWTTYLRALFRRDTYGFLWSILAFAGGLPAIVIYGLIIWGTQALVMLVHTWKTSSKRRAA